MLSRLSKSREAGSAETPPSVGALPSSNWRGWIFQRYTFVAALLAGAIFVVDLTVPLGIAIAVAYVTVVLLGWWFKKTHHIFLFAVACSLLTITGYFYSPSGAATGIVLTNRIIAVCAIWLTAVLVAKTKESAGQARRTAERLTAVTTSAVTGMISIDAEGTITSFNPAAEKVFGFRADEVISKNVSMLMPEPYQGAHGGYVSRYLAGGAPTAIGKSRQVSGRRRDGSVFPMELAVGEMRSDGKRYFVGFVTDLTERTRTEAKLRQAQRMEALGRLTGAVAHEFNNQLLAIDGFARLLQRASADEEREKTWIDNILTATGQASSLTDQLLCFGGKQVLAPKVLGIAGVLRELQILLRPMVNAAVILKCEPNDEQARVRVDPAALSQALLNLAINASDAMPDGGVLTLSSRVVRLDRPALVGFEEARPGPYVAASVSDTGSGIDEDMQQDVFEPFFTTKKKGSGTGLGLSMVYGMARQCGGAIALDSRPGAGTTVTIYLPLVEEAVTEEVPLAAPALRGGGETLLIAEDEAMVRDFLKTSLEKLGYRVLMADGGTAAQRIFHEREGRIDLLVTDMAMPGLSGRQLARGLVAKKLDLKVLYITGYDAFGDGGWRSREDETVIRKPFSLDDLGRSVRKLLDGR